MRRDDGQEFQGDFAGWDPATQLARAARRPAWASPPIVRAAAEPRVGHLALAIARSWSNAVTATAGLVSVIGGPLQTGRRRSIERVIRTSAPMHEGFSGGAFVDTAGALLGVATAISIRGLGVVIPVATAWTAAASLLEHGSLKRGYLGIVGQPVSVPDKQRGDSAQATGPARRGRQAGKSGRHGRVCWWETSCSRSTISALTVAGGPAGSAGRRQGVASRDAAGDSRQTGCLGDGDNR